MGRFASVIALIVLAATSEAQDVRVEASVNAERIGVQDVLELTVSISGGSGASIEPELPELEGFRVAGRSTSSQFQIVNGRMSSTLSYIYSLLPQKEGTFTIGAVRVEHGGEVHRTDPITVEVVSGSVLPRSGRRSGGILDPFEDLSPFGSRREPEIVEDDLFVRTEVSKRSVYQGEQVVVTYRLYSRFVPLGPQTDDDPPLTGFWVEDVDLGSEPPVERRTVEGKEYITFPLKQRILFPTRTGTLEIPPITVSTAVRLSSGDPFDTFFARASRPFTLRSQPVELEVRALPAEGRSPDFIGAVGRYQLSAKLDEEEVEAGNPVTLTLAIEGEGNLRAVEAPDLPGVPGFRAFDPKTEETLRAAGSGLSGEKRWEYVLVPESGGVKELGPWSLQYFDPGEERYVTASVGPLKLRVSGGLSTAEDGGPAVSARREVALLTEDIRFLKEPPETFGTERRPFYETRLFYLSLALPIAWNLGLLAYRKRKEKEKAQFQLFRSRRAHRMARRRLKKAASLARDGSKGFYEEIAAALYRYVGDKMSVSPEGLTTSSIDRLFEKNGVPEELRRDFIALITKCEEARFTPGERTREEMEALRDRTEELIVSVERHLG